MSGEVQGYSSQVNRYSAKASGTPATRSNEAPKDATLKTIPMVSEKTPQTSSTNSEKNTTPQEQVTYQDIQCAIDKLFDKLKVKNKNKDIVTSGLHLTQEDFEQLSERQKCNILRAIEHAFEEAGKDEKKEDVLIETGLIVEAIRTKGFRDSEEFQKTLAKVLKEHNPPLTIEEYKKLPKEERLEIGHTLIKIYAKGIKNNGMFLKDSLKDLAYNNTTEILKNGIFADYEELMDNVERYNTIDESFFEKSEEEQEQQIEELQISIYKEYLNKIKELEDAGYSEEEIELAKKTDPEIIKLKEKADAIASTIAYTSMALAENHEAIGQLTDLLSKKDKKYFYDNLDNIFKSSTKFANSISANDILNMSEDNEIESYSKDDISNITRNITSRKSKDNLEKFYKDLGNDRKLYAKIQEDLNNGKKYEELSEKEQKIYDHFQKLSEKQIYALTAGIHLGSTLNVNMTDEEKAEFQIYFKETETKLGSYERVMNYVEETLNNPENADLAKEYRTAKVNIDATEAKLVTNPNRPTKIKDTPIEQSQAQQVNPKTQEQNPIIVSNLEEVAATEEEDSIGMNIQQEQLKNELKKISPENFDKFIQNNNVSKEQVLIILLDSDELFGRFKENVRPIIESKKNNLESLKYITANGKCTESNFVQVCEIVQDKKIIDELIEERERKCGELTPASSNLIDNIKKQKYRT